MLWTETLLKATEYVDNDRKKLGNVVYEKLQKLWSKSGISKTAPPVLRNLPIISLTRVEFCHMMFHHILPCACKAVKYSIKKYTSKTLRKLFNNVWPQLTRCKHRPSKALTTYLKNSNEGSKVTMKSTNVYTSGCEIDWHGECFGFHESTLNILDRIIVWIGVFFSDTLVSADIDWLKQECMQICVDIEQTPHIWYYFENKQCLYIWLNMVHYNIWIEELPIESFGLMFEGANKVGKKMFTLNQHWYKEKLILTYMSRERIIKDMEFHAMGIETPTKPGHGWAELYTSDVTHDSYVKKLLEYDMDENGHFSINLNKKYGHYDNGFIKILKPSSISFKLWCKYYNNMHDATLISKNIHKSGIPVYHEYMYVLLDYVLNGEQPWSLDQCVHLLLHALCAGIVTFYKVNGFATFYRNFMDSHVRKSDLTWIRTHNDDYVVGCKHFVLIENLNEITQFAPYIDNNNIENVSSILFILGNLWDSVDNKNLNFKLYKKSKNVPIIANTHQKICVNATYVVQQLYVKHDHIIPSQSDMYCISKILSCYPNVTDLHFKDVRSVILNNIENNVLPFCGMGWLCQELHPKINCMDCLNDNQHSGGSIISYCCEKEWPYYQALSIYQGYLNRMWNDRTVNELTR